MNKNIYPAVYKLTITNKKYPKATLEERAWVKKLYFEDVDLLKKLTQRNFDEWEDFKTL